MNQVIKYQDQQDKIRTYKELATIAVKSGCYGSMSVETATNVMLSAADLGVSPMKALNGGFHVIKGKISMAGHLISDRIRSAGHSIKVVEHTRDKCVIIGQRKDNGDSYKSEFDMEDAKIAGLLVSSSWKSYPKDMLYNRAVARLGRVLFSDVVGACYSEDEGHDIQGTKPEDRPCKDPDDIEINIPQATFTQHECDESDLKILMSNLVDDGYNVKPLMDYLFDLSAKKKESVEIIVKSALMSELLPKFKASYSKFLERRAAEPVAS